ncbi:MAG TPA: 3-hydroxyacyl-ACP dehydratase [Cytophagales bacterium]|nr:3-hydroxyacyl-ACP dehydratase [Cytophagales bacterium]
MEKFQPITDKNEVMALIPQRPPVVMVDKLLYNDEVKTVSGFTILQENIFSKGGVLKEPGIIENIAQTAAARAGYYYKSKNENPPIGFIGAVKNLFINFLPEVGKELITEVKVETEVMNATVISAEVKCEDKVVAGGEMKIFIVQISN